MKPCIRCRRQAKRLWCAACIAKGQVKRRREQRKPELERAIYADLDYPALLRRTREAMESM